MTPADVLDEIGAQTGLPSAAHPAPTPRQLSLLPEEERMFETLTDTPQHIDRIAGLLSLTTSQTLCLLLALELKEAVRQLPGKRFQRT